MDRFEGSLIGGWGRKRDALRLMPFKHNAIRRQRIPKMKYKVTNWPQYGSRSHIPVAWTDLGGADDPSAALRAGGAVTGRLIDFVNLRILADALLERCGESSPSDKEERHATEAELSGRAGGRASGTATAWASLQAEACARALSGLSLLIARMLADAGAGPGGE